jgi:hypothetical protein
MEMMQMHRNRAERNSDSEALEPPFDRFDVDA